MFIIIIPVFSMIRDMLDVVERDKFSRINRVKQYSCVGSHHLSSEEILPRLIKISAWIGEVLWRFDALQLLFHICDFQVFVSG